MLRTWGTLEELASSGFPGPVNARNRKASGKFVFNLDVPTLLTAWPLAEPPQNYYFNERPPDDKLLVQGDLTRTERGLQLVYNTTPGLTCREATTLCVPEHAYGLTAQHWLQSTAWPSSYDDLMELLDCYPDGVVEFSIFSTAVGKLPHRNHVIWEVRNY